MWHSQKSWLQHFNFIKWTRVFSSRCVGGLLKQMLENVLFYEAYLLHGFREAIILKVLTGGRLCLHADKLGARGLHEQLNKMFTAASNSRRLEIFRLHQDSNL